MTKNRIFLFSALFLVYCAHPRMLQASVPQEGVSDTLVVNLEEVVVTAFNRPQSLLEVPGSVSSLGSLLLQRERPSFNLLPVLDHAPGVFAHNGATNTSRVTIRGIGARQPYATGKIRVYFQNIPLTNTSGVSFLEDIDPAIVENMEIIKGPATSVYGAGLGGTIKLNVRKPGVRATGFSNSMQAGSWGLFRNTALADFNNGQWAASIAYSHTQSQGYRQNNEYQRDAITTVSQYSVNEQTHLLGLISFSGLKSHIPSSIDSTTFVQNPQAAAANWLKTRGYEDALRLMAGLSATHVFSQQWEGDLALFSIWHDEKEMRPFDVFYEERFTLGVRTSIKRSQQMGMVQLDVLGGGEFFRENYSYSNFRNPGGEGVQGDQFSDNREEVAAANVFLQTDAVMRQWNFSVGLNVNFTQRDYQDLFHSGAEDRSGIYDYGLIVSPRVSMSHLFNNNQSLYMSFSHGFSPPSLAETLTPEGYVNPDIKPERSWNLEAGTRGKYLAGRLFFDVSLYRMWVQDLLVAERVGEDAWVGKNAGASLHQGLEAELHHVWWQNPAAGAWQLTELSVRSNYALNHFRFTDFIDRDNNFSGNTIPGVPQQVFFASLFAQSGAGLYGSVTFRRVGRMQMNDANSRQTRPYSLSDLSLGYRNSFKSRWDLDVFLRLNNVFDKHYASMVLVNAPTFGSAAPRYYYPGLPRHFTAGLRVGIHSL
ncbi:MAG: TonB-dependent receptor [Bacteroidales bacterium]